MLGNVPSSIRIKVFSGKLLFLIRDAKNARHENARHENVAQT